MTYLDRSVDPLSLKLHNRTAKKPGRGAKSAYKKTLAMRQKKNYGLWAFAIAMNLISAFVLLRSFLS